MTIIDEDFLKIIDRRRRLRGSIAAIIAVHRWDENIISEKITDLILEKINELSYQDDDEVKKFNKKDHTLGHGCMD